MQMQYRAQRLGYQNSYPNAQHSIIWVGETRMGRILVDYGSTFVLLVDIALLTGARNHGIGTAILQALQTEAREQKLPLRLHVRFGNRALQLYQRLGFQQTGETETHIEMELPPAS
jgi:ribosomal protein S18 acetylase RimI-like enzyme